MKTPNSLLRLLSAAVLAALVALPAAAQVDLSRLVWIGDSEGAGYSANCLTKRVQVDSPGAVIARANGVDYQQPILSDWGTGGCLVLTSLAPSFGTCPGNAACAPPTTTGVPENLSLPRPYNNLAIGGCAIHDMLYATTAADARPGACASTIDLVLRNSVFKLGSQVDQAIALNPSFVILANFGNDYLGAVLSGAIVDGVTVTPLASFTADTNAALAKLAARQPKGIVTGIGNLTNFPFTTTLPPFVTSGGKLVLVGGQPIPLLGPKGCPTGVPACPMPANTIVTLNAAAYLPSGFGIPCAVAPTLPNCNKPLPAAPIDATKPGCLIYADDAAFLTQRIADYNAAIKAAAAAVGYKYYDINDWLVRTKAGFDYGGTTVSQAFLSGGIASYDGFHMTPIGYALLADDIIKFINASFPGANLKEPDLSVYLYAGGTAGGLSGTYTQPYAWSPLTDAEKATAIEGIFTPEFAQSLSSFIGMRRGVATPAPAQPARRVDRSAHADPQP